MKIKILMITFNRPEYTRLSLSRLCDTAPENARITVWDNGSSPETIEAIKKFESHVRIEQIIYNQTNARQIGPTNWFWQNATDADLLSKVDDDCLMPENWCEVLQQAHLDIPAAGVLGCWRFLPDDFNAETAERKIQLFGKHRIMRNCWVEGSGYLMKRAVIDKIGYMKTGESFTTYCIRAAAKAYINGWYYPFLYQEHMDDPRAEHAGINSEADFRRLRPASAQNFNIHSREEWIARLQRSAQSLQAYSYEPKDWLGIRAKIKRKIKTLRGKEYLPLAGGNFDICKSQ
jgi:glycosyltransferase involved in cell wall biosynthesis